MLQQLTSFGKVIFAFEIMSFFDDDGCLTKIIVDRSKDLVYPINVINVSFG
jgi:hypothetical protein